MNKQKLNIVSILILMIATGLAVYLLFFYNEKFENSTTTIPATTLQAPATTLQAPATTIQAPATTLQTLATETTLAAVANTNQINSIISKSFGVGFNVMKTSKTTTPQTYMIEHIPITPTGTMGGVYATAGDGAFTVRMRDENDPSQLWNFNPITIDKTTAYLVQPATDKKVALMYANGSLSLRPLATGSDSQAQHWILSSDKVNRGVPVLNVPPASMFSSEFVPNAPSKNGSNDRQIQEVLAAVKSGIAEYMGQMNKSQPSGQITSSSLGTKSQPLDIKLNLSGGGTSSFKNVDGFASVDDGSQVLSLLDRYDNNTNKMLFNMTDLENALATSGGCKNININDYTSSRVGQCNCVV